MNLPNLLLAGFPRCGTTSLYDWLVQHPEIAGGIDKELFYLVDEDYWMHRPDRSWKYGGARGYAALFPKPARWLTDGTTVTAYQSCALEFAAHYQPRVLFVIRDPAARAYSLYRYFRDTRAALPPDTCFADVIQASLEGVDTYNNTQLRNIVSDGYYFDVIAAWQDVLPHSHIYVLPFDHLQQAATDAMQNIFAWLGVADASSDIELARHNVSTGLRSPALEKLKIAAAHALPSKAIKNMLRPLYLYLNSTDGAPMTAEEKTVLDNLYEHYRPHNDRLHATFGIPLGH